MASVHCPRLSTYCVCSLSSRPRPDGLRRSARIGHAAFNGSGKGASPPVCHIASVHCPRLSTACVCPLPSRPRPDGLRRSARIVMRHSMVAERAQALRCVTLRLSTARVCPLPAFVHCPRLSTYCVCSLSSRPRPDGLRRSARIGHAAFNGSGKGASPPVCHIASVHCPRLSTYCVCSLSSRPRPDGLRRSARIGHAAFNGSGMGASPVCDNLMFAFQFLRAILKFAPAVSSLDHLPRLFLGNDSNFRVLSNRLGNVRRLR